MRSAAFVRTRRAPPALAALTAALVGLAMPARAVEDIDLVRKGGEIASGFCARCHGIGQARASPVEGAPPFRELAENPALTQQAIRQLLITTHERMPDFLLSDDERTELAAYIKSLARH